jgi:hypothetical protein
MVRFGLGGRVLGRERTRPGATVRTIRFAQTRQCPATLPDDPFRPPAAARRTSALATLSVLS